MITVKELIEYLETILPNVQVSFNKDYQYQSASDEKIHNAIEVYIYTEETINDNKDIS